MELDLNNNTELAPAEDDPEETPPQYLPSFKIEVSKPQVTRTLHTKFVALILTVEIEIKRNAVMLHSFKTIKLAKKGL